MTRVNIHQAKTHLSRLLARVQAGEEVVIAKRDRAIARIIPYEEAGSTRERRLEPETGGVRVLVDPTAPLPAEELAAFETAIRPASKTES